MTDTTVTLTAFYAGLIALIYLALSARVIRYRFAHRLSLGDYGDKALLARMRAQANCAEYAPIALLLLLLVELSGAPSGVIHALGLMLFVGRLCHAIGFSRHPQIFILRQLGMVLTLGMILASALGLIGHAAL